MVGDQAIRIARAIFAGAPHQEVAAEFGVTVREVQAAVERARRLAARNAARARRPPDSIRLCRKVEPAAEPIIWEPNSRIARELGLKAVRQKPGGPSVPYLTFLHGA